VAIPRAPRPPPAHAPTPPEAPPAEPAPPRAATLTPPRPSATRCAAPDYPESARREGAQGRVVLRLRISAAGRVLAAEVAKSSGWRSLDAAALAAVARWEFIPALEDGRPVPFAVLVPVNFALEE
ncbi:MAG: energy transducer TonB, partial [Planctomycetaceae bacterium]